MPVVPIILARVLWIGIASGMFLPSVAAGALAPLLADYSQTAWGPQDGAPSDVVQFAQTTDGWLWLASAEGLFRFDGVRFERKDVIHGQRLYANSLVGLLATPDGALWIGHRRGGVTQVKDGRMTVYKPGEGLLDGAVFSLARGPDGAIWASTTKGLGYLAPGARRFITIDAGTGLPRALTHKVLFTRDGRQWVATASGMFYRDQGARRYRRAWPSVPVAAMDQAPDGTLWASDGVDKHYRMHTSPPRGNPRSQSIPGGSGMHFDRDGVMWIIKGDALERRTAPFLPCARTHNGVESEQAQQLGQHNGMRSSFAQMWFQDREGNIWVGMSTGVARLRSNRVRPLVAGATLARPSVIADARGKVLIGETSGPLRMADATGIGKVIAPIPVGASARGPDGTIWVGNNTGLWRREAGGRWINTPLPAPLKGFWVRAILPLRDGRMWVSIQGHGLFRVDGGQWRHNGGLAGLPNVRAEAFTVDAGGRTWIALVGGTIACIDREQVRLYGEADGLKLGNVQSMLVDGEHLWAGGEYGVAHFDGRRWVTVAPLLRGISGMTRTSDGELWLHGAEGVTRVSAAEVARALARPGRALAGERFNGLDGLAGGAEQVGPLPSLTQGSDGRLWFTTAGQVASMDPRHVPRNRLAPPVQVIALHAHGRKYEGAHVELPVGTDELEIFYTALGLRMPERIRFRYRLHGVDREWHDAGTRRDVMFNNLGPGSYRFQVTAANEDGVWNPTGAEVTVRIPPRFVQTLWFKALIAALAAVLLYCLYRFRLRQLTRRMDDLVNARLTERARIARGLHDTLLQSVQGLIMFFNAQARRLPHGAEERQKIDQTLAVADQLMSEGRDYILDLRAATEPRELGEALRDYGTVLLQERLTVSVPGVPCQLLPMVRGELHAIAREALFNAARHAQASTVEVLVEYGQDSLHLSVRDDGCGGAGERPGHYGLRGMRERADAIGATLTLLSNAGSGTVIDIVIPGRKAYAHLAGADFWPRLRQRLRWLNPA